ncbi:hypothetical protein [Thalassospira lucentensis]|uniref:hypothetical protein n=1 Tax=Thalassospira lucentensis TaxID=168935 RepID=UPI003AA8EE11
MRVVVTEVTDMTAGNHCVAAFNLDDRRMLRLLPDGGNWPSALVQEYNLSPGSVLEVTLSGVPHNGSLPHSKEDARIVSTSIDAVEPPFRGWLNEQFISIYESLGQAFSDHLEVSSSWKGCDKVFVAEGANTSSLVGVGLDRNNFEFFEENFGGNTKLRVRVDDESGCYNLAVTSTCFKKIYADGGLDALNRALPKSGKMHLRIGLARPMDGRCAVMLNGVNW